MSNMRCHRVGKKYYWVYFHVVLSSGDFFQNHFFFSKYSLSNTVRKSNSLNPDEARRLQRLLADDTRRQRSHVYNVR